MPVMLNHEFKFFSSSTFTLVDFVCSASWVLLIVLCVVEQHEGGVNPTDSMTRALISDDSIARQSALGGPVQLGYVSYHSSHSS